MESEETGYHSMAIAKGMASTPLERPIRIGARMSKNRFVIQPMECGDSNLRGGFSEDTLRRYDNLCRGGAGVVVMEAITLQYESRARRTQLLLDVDDPDNRAQWEKFFFEKRMRYPDTLFIVQLHHSGELSDDSFSRRVCVKPLPGYGGDLIDADYIEQTIDSYVKAAHFLYQIGADGVDLKFCHGYLFSQILRPYNDRCWKYGGSFANRSRFAFELCEKVRRAIPDERFLIGAKVSVYDEMPGGQGHDGPYSPIIDPAESIALCKGLEERGASYFIESLGNAGCGWSLMCPDHYSAGNVFQHMSMAKLLRKNLRPETAVICGGLSILRDGKNNGLSGLDPEKNSLFYWGNTGIEQGDFDMIALGRQSLADPFLPRKYLDKQEKDIHWCLCCNRCSELEAAQQHCGCAIFNKPYAESYRSLKAKRLPCDQ